MTKEELKKEFAIKKLKNANKQLMNTNTILNRQYKNLNEHFEKRLNEEVDKKIKIIKEEKQQSVKTIETKTKTKTRGLYKDYELLQEKYDKIIIENKNLLLKVHIAEDAEVRAKKREAKKTLQVNELKFEIKEVNGNETA